MCIRDSTKTEVDTAIANLVDSAPDTLDTLNELANALGDDANFATAITASIGTKANQSTTYSKIEVDNLMTHKTIFDVSVDAKSANHSYTGGSSYAFFIDGVESPVNTI